MFTFDGLKSRSLTDLFKIRDALKTLRDYGLRNEDLTVYELQVNYLIEDIASSRP